MLEVVVLVPNMVEVCNLPLLAAAMNWEPAGQWSPCDQPAKHIVLEVIAFIEAFWSSMTWIEPTIKYIVGISLWIMLWGYLLLAGKSVTRAEH